MPYLLKHREQLSLAKLCTVHIPYICYCRNVYYLWEFTGLQTPMKLKQPWQDSPSGMLQCWEYIFHILLDLTLECLDAISSKICIQHNFKMTRLSSIIRPFQPGLQLSPEFSQYTESGQEMIQLAFLRLTNIQNWGKRGEEGVQAKRKWGSQIHQEAILREQSLIHKR